MNKNWVKQTRIFGTIAIAIVWILVIHATLVYMGILDSHIVTRKYIEIFFPLAIITGIFCTIAWLYDIKRLRAGKESFWELLFIVDDNPLRKRILATSPIIRILIMAGLSLVVILLISTSQQGIVRAPSYLQFGVEGSVITNLLYSAAYPAVFEDAFIVTIAVGLLFGFNLLMTRILKRRITPATFLIAIIFACIISGMIFAGLHTWAGNEVYANCDSCTINAWMFGSLQQLAMQATGIFAAPYLIISPHFVNNAMVSVFSISTYSIAIFSVILFPGTLGKLFKKLKWRKKKNE